MSLFNKKFVATAIVLLFAFCFVPAASAWWDANYLYRKQITVTNNDSIQLAANTIVAFTADTATLISGSKLRSDGKDWRIVYDNGGTESEIDQLVEGGWDSALTETWFRLQAAIDASATTTTMCITATQARPPAPRPSRQPSKLLSKTLL